MQSASDPTHRQNLGIEGNGKTQDSPNVELNAEIAKAVTKALSYFGSGPVVESLVYILELEHSVDLNSLSDNLDALRAALLKMFGGAAYVIEDKITESLAKQLGVDPDGKKLEELVGLLRGKLEGSTSEKNP